MSFHKSFMASKLSHMLCPMEEHLFPVVLRFRRLGAPYSYSLKAGDSGTNSGSCSLLIASSMQIMAAWVTSCPLLQFFASCCKMKWIPINTLKITTAYLLGKSKIIIKKSIPSKGWILKYPVTCLPLRPKMDALGHGFASLCFQRFAFIKR
jgi:hypothetical protein